MSKLGSILSMAAMMSATSSYGGQGISMKQKGPEPEWKRKKCKSCKYCGYHCSPYIRRGHTLTRQSKPTYSACKDWEKKSNG